MELPYLRPLKIYMERMKQAPSCERVRSISCSVEQWLFLWFLSLPLSIFFLPRHSFATEVKSVFYIY